jgi:hypothetical protein
MRRICFLREEKQSFYWETELERRGGCVGGELEGSRKGNRETVGKRKAGRLILGGRYDDGITDQETRKKDDRGVEVGVGDSRAGTSGAATSPNAGLRRLSLQMKTERTNERSGLCSDSSDLEGSS